MSLEPIVNSLENFLRREDYRHHVYDKGASVEVIIDEVKPDLVLFAGAAEGPHWVSPERIKAIKDVRPIINIICDGGCPKAQIGIAKYQEAESFTFHVNIDGMTTWPHTDKDLTTLCPIDLRYYPHYPAEKIIHLGFYGGAGHGERRAVLEHFGETIAVGTRNETYGTYANYANFMRACRYVLNHAANGSNTGMHCKARVLEAALGNACLIEQAGSPIAQYFEPGVDYFEYTTPSDIDRILAETTEETRQKTADNLTRKVLMNHSSILFWGKVFNRLREVTRAPEK